MVSLLQGPQPEPVVDELLSGISTPQSVVVSGCAPASTGIMTILVVLSGVNYELWESIVYASLVKYLLQYVWIR